MPQMTAHDEVRELLDDLRAHIVKITKRPIDPDVDHYTDTITTLTASYMLPAVTAVFDGVGLTRHECRIMDLLVSNPGRTFTKQAIMTALYFDRTGDEPEIKIVDIFICHLRRKLKNANSAFWVETVWGLGYRYVERPAREGHALLQHQLKDRSHYAMPSDGMSIDFGKKVHVASEEDTH